jgi:DNA-binding MarR family transcriptional regulator
MSATQQVNGPLRGRDPGVEQFADEGAEKIVLASMLNGGDNGEFPSHELFFLPQHQVIHRGLAALKLRRIPADTVTLTQELIDAGELENAGGASAITDLGVDFTAKSPELVRYELGRLHELRAKRELRRIGERLINGEITPNEAQEQIVGLNTAIVSGAEKCWLNALTEAIVTSSELHDLQLTPRKKLLGDWFCEGDLGFIFAFRGVGKTWLALAIAQALSAGGKLGDWRAHECVTVLYVDGEMPPDLMRSRCEGLDASNVNLQFLNHEILFERTGRVLNVTNREVQQAITQRCIATGAKVIVLDNLSTLASGMKENEADSWELVNNWLLDLRRRKIAVVIVHHAGRSGEMRGTSKREDNVFWIIALDDGKKDADDKRGARFISHFTKPSRNTQEEVPAYEWHFVTEANGEVSISCKQAQSIEVFRRLIEDGVTECAQIAQEMKVSPATVSRFAKKAIDAGWLRKDGREYVLIEREKTGEK